MLDRILYPKFNDWIHGGQIYLYSDPHFSDKDMTYRNISDEEQIKRINSKIGKNDTIIFLGDIGNLDCIKKIRGYKVLIKGNHDEGITKFEEYFDEVYPGVLIIAPKIVLSHKPVDFGPCFMNIHGHVHDSNGNDQYHLNICAEYINYTPVSLKELIKNGLISKITDFNRDTIDNAIKNARRKKL